MLGNLKHKIRIWFWSTAEEDIMLLPIEDKTPTEITNQAITRNGEQHRMADPDHDVLREEVMTNREMVNNMRIRISQIDERTAFMAKILFGLFISVVAGTAAGVILAFAGF